MHDRPATGQAAMSARPVRLSRIAEQMTASTIREILKVTQRPDIISFAGGLPAPELFPLVEVRAATGAVLDRYGPAALQYSTTEGHPPLRAWLGDRAGVPAQNVQIVSGSQQGLDLLGRVLLDPGDLVAVENPTYLGALQALRPYGARFVAVPTDDDGISPDGLDALLAEQPVRLLYAIPTFQNPTGRTLSRERREALLDVAERHDLLIIEDGPYSDLRFRGQAQPSLFELALARAGGDIESVRVISLGTFSKTLVPGLRDAWVLAPGAVIDKLVQAKQGADLHSPTLNQMIIAELVEEVLPRQIARVREAYGQRCAAMLAALAERSPAGVHWTRPEGGMFLWLTLPEGLDAEKLLISAVEAGVAFVPGASFFAAPGEGANTMRLSYVTVPEDRIRAGVGVLADLIDQRR